MNYSQAMNKMLATSLFNGMNLSLNNIQLLDKIFDNPSQAYESIHIAGTNGKGSVTKKTTEALIHEGFKVGMFISPHISCFRERISINHQMISEESTLKLLKRIFAMIEMH